MLNRLLDSQYEILAVLHPGETATVYYGWDHRAERPVTIAEVSTKAAHRDRLAANIIRCRRLQHPNLVTIYAARQEADGQVYVIMEYLDGMGLNTALDRLRARGKRLPPALGLFIARQILQGLDYIHTHTGGPGTSRPVLEGFSPGDVILAARGSVKLRGFGLGGRESSRLRYSVSEERNGGEAYDLRVIGRLLYEMLLGESAPKSSLTLPSDGTKSSKDVFQRARLPKPVAEIAQHALSVNPDERYVTSRAMADDIWRAENALGAGDPLLLLADLLDALEDESEAAEHRRILMLRGSVAGTMQDVTTAPLEADGIDVTPQEERETVEPYPWDGVPQTGPEWTEKERRRWPTWITVCIAALLVGYMVADLYWGFGPLSQITGIGPANHASERAHEGDIVTVPPGAEFTINGRFAGRTPCALDELPSGPVTLRLTLPGLIPIDTVLIVNEGETVGPFPPFIFRCNVHFNSVPEGAKVVVNGHELSDMELARFTASVSDTLSVVMRVEGEQSLPEAAFNPLIGFVAPTDTTLWRWHPRSEESPGQLTGVFRREIYIRSDPPGAMVYVDDDSTESGYTDLSLPLPYGDHVVTLHLEPFMDYRFAVHIGEESPGVFSAVLKRTVQIGAIDRRYPDTDIGATIEWIREGTDFVRTPFDDVKTPYSIQLGGLTQKIRFTHPDFWDTIVTLSPGVDRLQVAMRRMSEADRERLEDRDDRDNGGEAWVRFQVRDRDGPVADAEVIGVEKSTGVVVRYGTTGEAGQIITMVPPGDYDWRATKQGYEGRMNGERIKPGRGLKKITLRLAKR